MIKEKLVTYLAGPIDDCSNKEARNWRRMLTKELGVMGIETLDPFSKGDGNQATRSKISNWTRYGNVDAIRQKFKGDIIDPDLRMVESADFVTLFVPAQNEAEVCGSYGEITLAYYLNKPVYIVTKRQLKPLNLPNWAIGCSERIFKNFEEYLAFIKDALDDTPYRIKKLRKLLEVKQ